MNLVYIILAVLVAVVSIAVRKASRQREGYTSDRVFERTPQMPYKVNPTVLRTNLNKLGNRVFELQGLLSTGTSSVSLRRNWEIELFDKKTEMAMLKKQLRDLTGNDYF